MQRALMQFFKPENYFEVREALRQAGRSDLIGDGCDCLIPSKPPREAVDRRRQDANQRFRGEYVHRIAKPNAKAKPVVSQDAKPTESSEKKRKGSRKERRNRGTAGYRPGRKGASE